MQSKKYPKDIDWNQTFEPRPVDSILRETAKKFPKNTALSFEGKKWSYAELDRLVDRAAKGFQDQGIKKGDRVALCLPNSPYYMISYYGALRAGATVVNMNPLYSDEELTHLIQDSGADMVLTVDKKEITKNVMSAAEKAGIEKVVHCPVAKALPWWKGLIYRIIFARDIFSFKGAAKTHLHFDDLLKNKGDYSPVEIDPEKDVALFQYTGGTTGLPKGAMLTHANLSANTDQASAWFSDIKQGEDKMLAVLPFFHVFAMTVVMNLSVKNGLEIIATPTFELDKTIKLIDKKKPTLFPAVPSIYSAINNHKKVSKFDLSSIKFCLAGGAPLPVDVKEEFERLTGCKLVEGYGLSESSPVATCNPLKGENKKGSIGMVLPGTTIELRDLEDDSLITEFNKAGELCIRGPQVMKGYHNNDEATKKTLQNGLLRTGDVAVMDEDGYYYIVDRIKDMIISYGYNVYPREVEDEIYKFDAVEECIVAGMPDDKRGERVCVWIKLKEGKSLNEEELMKGLKDRLAYYKLPKQIEFRSEPLPKTLIGKLSRKDMVKIAKEEAQQKLQKSPKLKMGT